MGDFDDDWMADYEGAPPSPSPPSPDPSDAEVYAQVAQDVLAKSAFKPVSDPQAAGKAPAVTGGVLDPRTFPSYLNPGAPVAAPPAGGVDLDTYAEVDRDVRKAQALRPVIDSPLVAQQPALITGPLMTGLHADALQNFYNAQAGLPPVKSQPETWLVNGQPYHAVSANTFDASRSNGVTSMPTPEESAVANSVKPSIRVPSGGPEQGGAIATLPNPSHPSSLDPNTGLVTGYATAPAFIREPYATTGQTADAYTLALNNLGGGTPLIHWHPLESGMVDVPKDGSGFGDTGSLAARRPAPMATVWNNQVGWHVLDNGQLKFLCPAGSMSGQDIDRIQKNLDQEQKMF